MSLPISSILSSPTLDPTTTARTATQEAPQAQPQGDTVVLSQSAQINELNLQGESAREISESLGIPLSTVNSDLQIVAASTAAAVPDATVAASTQKT